MNRAKRRKRAKPALTPKEISNRTFEITIGCCLLTMKDVFNIKSEEDIEKFFDRYNENIYEFNHTSQNRLLDMIAIVREEFNINLKRL